MMIVVSLILILVSIALPVYNRSILRAKESVLKQDLFTLRQVISQYTLDKQKAPQTLDDLVQAGYLKVIPKDPFTNEANWTPEQEDSVMAVDQQDARDSGCARRVERDGYGWDGLFELVSRRS